MGFFETEWERPEFESVPELAQNAVYLLRDCEDLLVRKALQEAYRDFCKRSAALRTWRKTEVGVDDRHFVVAPVLSGEIDCVTRVMLEGRLDLPPARWVVAGDPPVLTLKYSGPRYNTDGEPDFLLVEAVEVPHLNEERAPKAFLRRYGDALVDGALARLYSMTNRPWSDMEQARQRWIAYANALNEARMRSAKGGPAANASGFGLSMKGMV